GQGHLRGSGAGLDGHGARACRAGGAAGGAGPLGAGVERRERNTLPPPMAAPVPPAFLRPGVLDGRTVVVAGGGAALVRTCADLGARTPALEVDLLDEDAVEVAARALGSADALVCDLAAPFAAAGAGLPGLSAALDGAWNAARAVANAAWIAADGTGAGGKLVLVAPAPGAGAHA